VRISMEGKGRWRDNVFIERLWRSLKYECVCLHAFETATDARNGIGDWIRFYGAARPHSTMKRAKFNPAAGWFDEPGPPQGDIGPLGLLRGNIQTCTRLSLNGAIGDDRGRFGGPAAVGWLIDCLS
jgi:Integrase core domain